MFHLVYIGAQVIKIVIISVKKHHLKIDTNAVLIFANCSLWCNVLVMRCRKIYLPLQVHTQNAISGQVVL